MAQSNCVSLTPFYVTTCDFISIIFNIRLKNFVAISTVKDELSVDASNGQSVTAGFTSSNWSSLCVTSIRTIMTSSMIVSFAFLMLSFFIWLAARKETQSSLFNSRPICKNPLLKFRLALSERHRSLVHFKVQRLLESPPCAMMLTRTNKCHVISSPDINLHVLVTSSRSMQEHAAKLTEQNAHTRECIS